ncbi:MAG TPA: 3-hydroxybutyryl-CoA dehydrogenase [Planctomycetes bacterium]|nr:3-hydroxybutyryl-CoA dehydrogenase [Planctomycetota bacterium]
MSEHVVAVFGAGTMGHGIAQVLAQGGYQVRLFDLDGALLEAAQGKVRQNLEGAVKRGKLEADAVDQIMGRLVLCPDLDAALGEATMVIEAIPERLELKKSVLSDALARQPKLQLVGTNTSSLPVTEIAQATPAPERVIGLHFFNPVHISKLVEIVLGERTSDATKELGLEVVRAISKTPIVVNDAPGFASSRLGLVLGLESMRMLEQGVAGVEDIDQAMELGYRHPMGPLKTTDYVGLDVRLAIAEHLHREVGEAFRPPLLLRRLVRAGKLGRKSGEGFYRWDDAGKCLGPALS